MKRTRWATIVVVVGLSLVALWAALSDPAAKSGAAQTGGEPSTPVRLEGKTLDGGRYDVRKHRGTPVVINFFASWCPSCAREAGDLTAFARSHPEVAFVGVDIRDTRAKGREWVMKYDVPFPIVFDREGTIASRYGVVGIPATFFLDRRGVERAVITGPSTLQGFEEKLRTVL